MRSTPWRSSSARLSLRLALWWFEHFRTCGWCLGLGLMGQKAVGLLALVVPTRTKSYGEPLRSCWEAAIFSPRVHTSRFCVAFRIGDSERRPRKSKPVARPEASIQAGSLGIRERSKEQVLKPVFSRAKKVSIFSLSDRGIEPGGSSRSAQQAAR